MSSNEDPSAGRDQEEKGTEEVEVGGRSAEGGENEAVDGGGDDPVAGGGDGSVRFGVLGSSTYTDTEVRQVLPGQRLEAVAQGKLSERQMRSLLGGSSKTPKELLQSLLLTTANAEASAAEAVAAVDAKVAVEAAREASAAEAVAAVDAKVAAEAAREASAAEAEAAVDAKVAAEAALAVAAAAAAAATVAVEEARAEASAAVAVAINAAGRDLGSPGTSELGTGSAAAIESMLRARLQGSGYSDAPVIAKLVARLPTDQGIACKSRFVAEGNHTVGDGVHFDEDRTATSPSTRAPSADASPALLAALRSTAWDVRSGLATAARSADATINSLQAT